MKRKVYIIFILIFIPFIFANAFEVKNSVISSGSNPAIKATIGQPIVGKILQTKAGFWYLMNILEPYFDECDVNQDGKVDIKDMQKISAHFGFDISDDISQYDLNGDGNIDGADINKVVEKWGR
jgi:hypothetical protein